MKKTLKKVLIISICLFVAFALSCASGSSAQGTRSSAALQAGQLLYETNFNEIPEGTLLTEIPFWSVRRLTNGSATGLQQDELAAGDASTQKIVRSGTNGYISLTPNVRPQNFVSGAAYFNVNEATGGNTTSSIFVNFKIRFDLTGTGPNAGNTNKRIMFYDGGNNFALNGFAGYVFNPSNNTVRATIIDNSATDVNVPGGFHNNNRRFNDISILIDYQNQETRIWVNGREAGRNPSPFYRTGVQPGNLTIFIGDTGVALNSDTVFIDDFAIYEGVAAR